MEHQGERCVASPAPPQRELSKHRAIFENQYRQAQNGNLGKLTMHAKTTNALNFFSLRFPLFAGEENPQNTGSHSK